MDGREYISAFRIPDRPDIAIESVATPEQAGAAVNRSLAEMVIELYREGQIHELTSNPPPPIAEEAAYGLELFRQSAAAARPRQMEDIGTMRRNGMLRPDTVFRPEPQVDLTHTLPLEKLTDISEIDKNNIHNKLVAYSLKLVNVGVDRISRLALRAPVSDMRIAQEIKDMIANEHFMLGHVLNSFRGVISVEDDYNTTGQLGLEDKVATRVKVKRPHDRHVPTWMPEANQWADPLGLLCSAIVEAEAFLVLQEWVAARKLPYLPIAAPDDFVCGNLQKGTDGNFRADILLCCLLPGRNEIIPVQVKNYIDQGMHRDYNSGVVLVSPQHLGTEHAERQVITVGSRQRIGTRLTTQYGKIMEQYFAIHPFGRVGKGKAPSKADRQAYAAALRPGFEYFDREIGRRIGEYTAKVRNTDNAETETALAR